jgi:hypothetical protein
VTLLNRRRFLITGTLAVPGALALGSGSALAEPPAAHPDVTYWLDWIAAHREAVAVAASDDAWGAIEHRERRPHVLASTIKIVHLSAYATAVAEGRLDPQEQIRVGDWDARHPYVSDGGAHKAALDSLGIPSNEFGIADDPDRTVPLDAMAAAMIDFSDNAATDYLRHRLGDGRLRHAAAKGGWHRPDLRSLQGEVILLIMPELLPPGTPTPVRVRLGDRLAERFVREPAFRREVFERIPTMPVTSDEQWPWTQGTALGTATQVAGLHRALASGRFRPRGALPIIHRHLERALAPRVPDEAYGIGFKGGGLPKTLNLGLNVRWKDGRTGALALMMTGLTDDDLTHQVGALRLGVEAITDPRRYADLRKAVAG